MYYLGGLTKMDRKSIIERKTNETNVSIDLNLDGSGKAKINTEIKFLDHMLTIFAKHSSCDLKIESTGDLQHHIIEDIAICLGDAFLQSLGNKRGIQRFGFTFIPMDCSLARVAIDLSNRPYHILELGLNGTSIEDMATEDIEHFLETFSNNLKANVHIKVEYGKNDHHKVEAVFKALAVSMKHAIRIDNENTEIPSSKGVL